MEILESVPLAASSLIQSLSDNIGPTTFTAGQLAGRTFRATLTEIQKAEVGRKYSRKDRRPLDPPPVAELQLFEITTSEHRPPRTAEIQILPDDDVTGDGAVCQVNLFPVPGQSRTDSARHVAGPFAIPSSSTGLDSTAATSSTDSFRFSYSNDAPPNIRPPFLHMDSSSTVEEEDRIVATYRDQPITEGSKLMNAIAGTSTVHSDTLGFENQGRIMFIFSVRIVPRSPSLILVSGRNTHRSDELSPDRRDVNPLIKPRS